MEFLHLNIHLTRLDLFYSIIFGLWLAIADWMAIATRTRHGWPGGIVVYLLLWALPMPLVWLFASPYIAAVGFLVGLVLSAIMLIRKSRRRDDEDEYPDQIP